MNTITTPRPSDFHTHLRSPAQVGEKLFRMIVEMNCQHYRYVVVEPNTFLDKEHPEHHIETADDMFEYRRMVINAMPRGYSCKALFLIKLTPRTTPQIIRETKTIGGIGLKLYPEGVTTGSTHGGVSDFFSKQIYECLECTQEEDLVLQLHPEMPKTFCLHREYLFHDVIRRYAEDFPTLRIFVEHITDRRTLELVLKLREEYGPRIFGTITGHHLHLTLDDVLGRVDHHCWPCAKYPEDRDHLLHYASLLLGFISITDSAPHEWDTKHLAECACAGVFNPARIAIPWVVQLFEKKGCLERPYVLSGFTSQNGLAAYKLQQDENDMITLIRKNWDVESVYDSGAGKVTPFRGGAKEPMEWQIVES